MTKVRLSGISANIPAERMCYITCFMPLLHSLTDVPPALQERRAVCDDLNRHGSKEEE